MDDEDSKIRRNLVAASGIVLSVAWLDIPFDTVASRIFGEQLKDFVLMPWKVWVAIFAALAYLLVRFRFSVDFKEAAQDIESVRRDSYQALYRRHLRNMSILMLKGKSGSRSELTTINEHMTETHSELLQARGWPLRVHMELDSDRSGRPVLANEWGSSPIRVSWDWTPPNDRGTTARSDVFNIEWDRWTRWKIRWLAVTRANLYSRGALTTQWPTVFAGLAMTVVFWKLTRALVLA